MSWRRWASVALLVGVSATTACGGGGGGGRATDAADGACDVVGIASRDLLAPEGLGFSDLVRDDPWTSTERDAVAAVRLLAPDADAGRYAALLDHLAARHRALVDGDADPGPPSARVRELASELDEALADGACG
ncbi:MAG: hypothetical protein R2702_05095 [Acidimicrobiales bacterium]